MHMRRIILLVVIAVFSMNYSNAQHIRVRLDFPGGASVRPLGNAPYRGAVWIGPEWRWQQGRYVHVPGYWAKPKRHGAIWVPGHWKQSRRGYSWIPGRWR